MAKEAGESLINKRVLGRRLRLIDLDIWMIDSTAVRATRVSSGAGKKGGLKNR
jgi:hypothetical protein